MATILVKVEKDSEMAQLQELAIIDIRTNDDLTLSIMRELDKVPYQSSATNRLTTIFRVPSHIRERNKNFYEPRMVSIGPYHWMRDDLKCMEDKKRWYLKKMLTENSDVSLHDYLEALRKLEPEARSCYYENTKMSPDEFVQMLLYDACFVIQVAVMWYFKEEEDAVFSTNWHIPLIKSDLLMLENQIPYFVLQCVFDIYSSQVDHNSNFTSPSSDNSEGSEYGKVSLSELLVDFLQHGSEQLTVPDGPDGHYNYDHLLDFYYHCYMRTQELSTNPMKIHRKAFPFFSAMKRLTLRRGLHTNHRKPRIIPCATELQEAGISFKKAATKSIFGVHFSHGVLRIPYISVEEARRPQIMNLIAFEQCYGQKHNMPLTSYAVFMDCIINTPRDVLLLQQNGIIENKLDDEKAAAEFFNQLRYICYPNYEDHHLAGLFQDVKKYCDSCWPKYRAKLYRDYFNNPWLIISFITAIAFLLLAFIQTLYTVVPYYHPSH